MNNNFRTAIFRLHLKLSSKIWRGVRYHGNILANLEKKGATNNANKTQIQKILRRHCQSEDRRESSHKQVQVERHKKRATL